MIWNLDSTLRLTPDYLNWTWGSGFEEKNGENVAKLENYTYFAIQKNDQPRHDIEKNNNTHTLV